MDNGKMVESTLNCDVSSSVPKASSTRYGKYNEESQSTFSSCGNSSSSLEVIDLDSVRDISEFARMKCNQLEDYIDDLFVQSQERISRFFEIDSQFSKSDTKVYQKGTLSETSNLLGSSAVSTIKENIVTTTTADSDGFRSFNSSVQEQLDNDEKENKRKYASIPITPCSISSIDTSDSDKTPYFSSRSYGGDDLRKILEEFSEKLSPKIRKNEPQHPQSHLQDHHQTLMPDNTYIGKPLQDDHHHQTLMPDDTYICKQESVTGFGNTYEVSEVSSIASVSEIAQILQDSSISTAAMIERLLSKGCTKSGSSLKSTNSDKLSREVKDIDESDCVRANDSSKGIITTNIVQANSLKSWTNLSARSEDAERFMLFDDNQTVPVPQLSALADNTLNRSERVNTCLLIPKRGFYRIETKKSDFEVVNASIESAYASLYTSLLSVDADAEKKVSLYDRTDSNITLSSSHTADFVKESRIKDWMNQHCSYNDVSRNSTLEPVHKVSSTCHLDSELQKTQKINRIRDRHTDEVIDGGYLCVGTQIKVVLTVINPSSSALYYVTVLKNVLVNGKMNLNASSVMVSDKLVKLDGHASTDISFIISPLVCGDFRIVIEFLSQNSSFPNVLRTVQLIGTKPSLRIIDPTNSCLSFGMLPELTHKYLPLVLKNESRVRIPLKFLIYENDEETCEFEGRCVMDPNESLECVVRFSAPEFSSMGETCYDSDGRRLDGRLLVMLDTAEEKSISISSLFSEISLHASVSYTRHRKTEQFPISVGVPSEIINNKSTDLEADKGIHSVSFCSSGTATPRSGSSSSHSSCDEGTLDLACTHTALTWPCTSIHSKQIQNITLRNKSDHREKLLFSICDSTGSFKLIENDKYTKELKIIMEANESRKVSVVFMPRSPERQVSGKITIQRRWTHSRGNDDVPNRRMIPLYGYGGETKLSIYQAFRDSEGRFWLNPDTETLEATFVLKNSGDSLLFVKLYLEDADDCIVPEETVIKPDKSVKVMCKLHLTADRVDILCRQNPSRDTVVVNNITLLYGSEASRRRIQRLWMQKERVTDVTVTRISEKLDAVCDFADFTDSVKVDNLLDPLSSLSKLWYESVTEQTIGILVNKEILETISLDKTVVFNDLNATIVE